MLGISYSKPSRLYISRYACRIDEGLDVYDREKARKEMEAAEKTRNERLLNRYEEVKVFAEKNGFSVPELSLKDLEWLDWNHSNCYPKEIEKLPKDFYKDLQNFVMDREQNEKGDGWQCLSKAQSITMSFLKIMYYFGK